MDMFEKAAAIRDMMELLCISQNEAANKMGVSQSYIANKVRLLKLEEGVKKFILENRLSERHARAILRIDGEAKRLETAKKIRDMKLTVSAAEALIDIHTKKEETESEDNYFIDASEFERIINEKIKALNRNGISAIKSESYYGNKKYITISIEQK